MKHGFLINEDAHDVGLSRAGQGYRLHHDGQVMEFDLHPGEAGGWILQSGHQVAQLQIAVDGDDVHIHLNGETYQLRFEHALQRLAQLSDASATDTIKATMPGSLVSLDVAPGDSVKKGQTLLVLAGEGFVQQEGEVLQAISPGDVVVIPANTRHWHGASASNFMSHIALQESDGGEVVEWFEHVSAVQYPS